MPEQAKVSSIDALEQFRSELIQYIKKARAAVEDAAGDVRRTKDWLERDRTLHWGNELRKRTKLLRQAEQELYSANLTRPLASNSFQKMAVQKAKRSVDEAEEKLRIITQWRRRFERLSSPHLRGLDPLLAILSQDLPRGVVMLTESIKALQAYAEKRPLPAAPPAATSTDPIPPP